MDASLPEVRLQQQPTERERLLPWRYALVGVGALHNLKCRKRAHDRFGKGGAETNGAAHADGRVEQRDEEHAERADVGVDE